MNASEAVKKLATGDAIVIDVREAAEVSASGMAEGALHVPLATIRMKADPQSPDYLEELKSGKPVAIYCASGGRSGMATQVLQQLGHSDVSNIGGFGDWVNAGGPVRR